MVEWWHAVSTCKRNNGKLFKPNETSFDVTLFSECNFKGDLWVAATYTNIADFDSAYKIAEPDSVIRCEMCKIRKNCGTICSYKECEKRCRPLCMSDSEPDSRTLHNPELQWPAARNWCDIFKMKLGNNIQDAASFSSCSGECFWTRNVIRLKFQTKIAPSFQEGECGILHNGTLSFKRCDAHLQPLCETVANIALETPRPYVSEGRNNSIMMNTKIISMTTTHASRRTNRIHPTIEMSSTYGALIVANYIVKRTTIGLNEENSSLLVLVGVTTKNDLEDSPHKSATGIIIGAVIGSVVFLMMTVLVIICFRRKLMQRAGKRTSKHDSKNMEMHKTDTINTPIYSYQCQDVSLETGSGLTPYAQLESKCEGSWSGQISNPEKSSSILDPEESNLNYATVTKKVNVNSRNSISNINYDSYDHLNGIQEGRDDTVAGNDYDTANFVQRNGCISTPDSIYSISGVHGKTLDESVGLYDRVNTTISDEYDMTYYLRTDGNANYDHI